jgi:DNA repair protein RecO (recombination protein O)
MNRNLKTDSIILRSRRIGELHKGLSCLTRSHGIVDAIAYGAGKGKSKLSGMVDPFSLLYLYLYYDPVRDSYKISDIEQKMIFPNIRMELAKFYIASFWAELLLKSFSGGGESELIYPLMAESLFILNDLKNDHHNLILIQFIWRYLGIAGFQTDLYHCGICSRKVNEADQLWYHERENQILCAKCKTDSHMLQFSAGGMKYLRHTFSIELKKSMKIGLDYKSADILKRILLDMIQGIVEYPLNTLKKGLLYHN